MENTGKTENRISLIEYARAFVRDTAVAVETLYPVGDLDSLAVLSEMIGDARVVGIGESAHGFLEFGLARHTITRFLIEELGFEVVCAETGLIGAFIVDRFVRGEELPEANVAAAHHFGFLEEIKNFIRWIREYNRASACPVHFCGIDSYISRSEAINALQTNLPGLSSRLNCDILDQDIDGQVSENERLAIRNVVQSTLLERALAKDAKPIDRFIRDKFLAENALWFIRHVYPTKRIILLTHNLHLQRYPYWEASEAVPEGHLMGETLVKELGDEMFLLATTSGWRTPRGYAPQGARAGYNIRNAPDSLDSVMDTAVSEQHLVDLRKAKGSARDWMLGQQTMRDGTQYLRVAPLRAFDAVLHLGSLRLSRELENDGRV